VIEFLNFSIFTIILSSIRTDYSNFSNSTFCKIFEKCQNLEVFRFHCDDFILGEQSIPEICKNSENLKHLEMDSCSISRENGRKIIQNCQQLVVLQNKGFFFVNSESKMAEVAKMVYNPAEFKTKMTGINMIVF
jgi:hypothetical protein